MNFEPPLISAILIRRYKRFLADVRLENGDEITVSVPNTGSMAGLTDPESRIWLSYNGDGKRKFAHALQLVEADDTIVGINTGLPNKLAEEAIKAGMVSDFSKYAILKREQKYGENSRIDMLLEDDDKGKAYIEVKNVHFMRQRGLAEFPDSKTERGAKHLYELADMVAAGHRAAMIYLIQRSDCETFQICRQLDPNYAAAFDFAMANGVEAYAIRCQITHKAIIPEKRIAISETIIANRSDE